MNPTLPSLKDRIRLTTRPEDDEPILMQQDWHELLFLHWRIAPEKVQEKLPPGLTVDTFQGDAYIGLVPFTMRNVRPTWFPALPGLSHFPEINVRTYVHRNGEPGVWFFSLDAANLMAVITARLLFHLPYYFAAMSLDPDKFGESEKQYYSGRYFDDRNLASHIGYTTTGTVYYAEPGSLDYFLCERYLLYAQKGDRLFSGRVYHSPYPLQDATVEELDDTLVTAAGFAGLSDMSPAHIAYASHVSVEVFGLQPIPD